jgi:hypothetical protein
MDSKTSAGMATVCLGIMAASTTISGVVGRQFPATWLGLVAAVATTAVYRKNDLSPADLGNGFGELMTAFNGHTDTIGQQVTALSAKLPPEIRSTLDKHIARAQDSSWVADLAARSKMVVGATGSGKTVYLLYEVWGRLNAGDLVYVADINYGKPCMGKPNIWFGLPKGRQVFQEPTQIADVITTVWDELQTRKSVCDRQADEYASAVTSGQTVDAPKQTFERLYFLMDEALSTLQTLEHLLSSDDYKEIVYKLSCILFEGRAYRVTVTLGLQDLRINELPGFTRAKLANMNMLILGSSADSDEVLTRVPGIDTQAKAKEVMSTVSQLRSNPAGKYACVVRDMTKHPQVCVKVLPEIDISGKVLSQQVSISEYNEEELTLLAQEQLNTGKSQWANALRVCGLGINAKTRKPEEHDRLRAYWDDLLAKLEAADHE